MSDQQVHHSAESEAQQLRAALMAAREVLDYIDGHGCDDDSREAEKGWKAIDTALRLIDGLDGAGTLEP